VISTFLVEHPSLTTTALVGFVVVGPFVGAWLAGRPRFAWTLVGLATAAVMVSTLAPTGRSLDRECFVEWAWPTLGRVEMMGNVVLFIPVALLLGVAIQRPLVAFLAGSALSALIELTQALVTTIGRSCDTSDWEANTLGSAIGALLAAAALAIVQRGRRSASAPRP